MRTKVAKWSQKLLSVGIPLSLIVGCSSEPSAQEKRNNFDKCVIETFAKKVEGETIRFIRDNRENLEDSSKRECAFHLD